MVRPTREQLINMAFAVLEEVAALSRHHAPARSRGVALALAYLAGTGANRDRWPFDEFWRAMRCDCRVARPARINAALAAIYDAHGRRRELAVISAFQRAANSVHGSPEGYPL